MAVAVNTQYLMYRADILDDLGIDVSTTWDEVLKAATVIRETDVVDYLLGATMKSGWNLVQNLNNMFLGYGGEFLNIEGTPNVNSDTGRRALETMMAMIEYMDPEYLVSDSTYVQQQFQQGRIAMANLWASRAAAMNDETGSQVVGLVNMAAAPMAMKGGAPAATLWWDGVVIAANIPNEEAEAARVDGCTHFQVFRWVIIPVMWPGVITTGLFNFLLTYNDFLVSPLLLDQSNQTMVPAAAVSITAPLFLLVMVFQRQILSDLAAGAVKG